MNKAELIDKIAQEADITKAVATKVVDAFIGNIQKGLKGEEKIAIAGFGTFAVSKRAARTGRNPQTGQEIEIKASKAPKFTPGKAFKEGIQ